MYGQSDVVATFHPSEREAFFIRAVETAQKTMRFLSEWQMSWRTLIEE